MPYRIQWVTKSSYASKTKEFDDAAFQYLYYAAIPCAIGYIYYALVYQTHRNWYFFLLNTSVGFIYAFGNCSFSSCLGALCSYRLGFIMMTPQLFINYKLKSVAAMPWRTMMYKALNTVGNYDTLLCQKRQPA